MALTKNSMTSLMQHAALLKELRGKAERLRTLSTEPGDDESDEEESWSSVESVRDDNKRLGWPQPTRFPTERERRNLTISTDDWVIDDVPDLSGGESCSSGESDSECEFSRSSDYDVRNAADSNTPDFKTPLPQSVTICACPDWRARMLLNSKSNPCKGDSTTTTTKSNTSSGRLVSGLGCASQNYSLTSSPSSEKSSSEVWKHEEQIPRPRTSSRLLEPSEFLGRSACQRLRALCAASSLDGEDEKEESGFACDTGLAASSSDQESDESDDEACPPQRTKARSDFPHPSEYLSPRAHQRLRALCGASPLDENVALLTSGELSE